MTTTDRPVDNAPYLRRTFGPYTLEGWSRAAVQSYWRVPELKIGFDLGAQPWDFMGTPNWFISHAHLDHVAALPVYVARRRMMKMEPPKIYVPVESADDIRRMLVMFQRLDRGRQTCEIIGVEPGQEIELSREHIGTVFNTAHTIPSRGLLIWERRRKLRDEFSALSGPEIRDLRLGGTEVTREQRLPVFCYTGDTSPAGLDNYPPVYEAKILLTEMSFIRARHRRDKIHKYGHMHLDDFIERMARFHNERIVVGHFSTRYHPDEVLRVLERKVPPGVSGEDDVLDLKGLTTEPKQPNPPAPLPWEGRGSQKKTTSDLHLVFSCSPFPPREGGRGVRLPL